MFVGTFWGAPSSLQFSKINILAWTGLLLLAVVLFSHKPRMLLGKLWISLLSILGSNNFGGFLSEHCRVCLAGEVQLYIAAAACLDGVHSALLDHADGEGVVGGDVLLYLAAGEVQTAAVACLGGKHPSLPDDNGGGELGAFILAWAGGRSLLCLLVGVDIQSESLLLLGDW